LIRPAAAPHDRDEAGVSWPALQPRSSLALAAIAELVGDDPKPRWEVASAIRHAMQQQLWDSRHVRYYSRNLK